jgi:urea transport system permease protein
MVQVLDTIFNGISNGSVLLISALGLAIVFGLMGVINLAHGELMMLGGYATFVVQNTFKILPSPVADLYIFPAIIVAFIVGALAGLILERFVIRRLYGRPLETLLATWGVSLILQQFVRSVSWQFSLGVGIFAILYFGGKAAIGLIESSSLPKRKIELILLPIAIIAGIFISKFIGNAGGLTLTKPWFGAQNIDVSAPIWLQGGMEVFGVQLPFARLFIIALTIACLTGIYWFLQKTSWGLRIRAVTQNRSMSACLGIPTARVDAIAFALGSGLAGVAGCAISLLGSVGPNTGQNYIIDTFMVVVVGGVGKMLGSILAALAIGTVNYTIGSGVLAILFSSVKPLLDFFTFFATTSMAKVLVFTLIIAFLQVRPGGIFPPKGRNAEL